GNDYNIAPDKLVPNVAGDCPSFYALTAGGFLPYIEVFDNSVNPPIIKFVNRDSFQIISAGPDGNFGPGANNWTAASGYTVGSPGADDFSNFHPMALGNGTNAQ
ncbi:MAG: hypothetical protein ACJ8F7_10560, partial [Gemmataceae bacterium]